MYVAEASEVQLWYFGWLYWDYIGIMENELETTTMGLYGV